MSSPEGISAVVLLCDYAQVAEGKLNIMGGGWSYLWVEGEGPAEIPLILAVNLAVPWALTNQDIQVEAKLLTEDGESVELGDEPVRSEGTLRVGRPPDARPGMPIAVPFVLPFPPIPLSIGGYVWEVTADAHPVSRVPFQVAQRGS